MDALVQRRWFPLLRTCIFALLVMGTVGVYLPIDLRLLSPRVHTGWRLVGAMPLMAGAYVALRCAFAFAWTGGGTPAPLDPPRRLVVTGLYRYVRNPMYLGMGSLLVGEWLMWGTDAVGALGYMIVFAAAVTLFVLLYEEPTLRRKFPQDYPLYVRNVPRFFPRLRPWERERITGATSA